MQHFRNEIKVRKEYFPCEKKENHKNCIPLKEKRETMRCRPVDDEEKKENGSAEHQQMGK